MNLCEFGVPQNRTRAFLTFVRKGTVALEALERTGRAPFPLPTHGELGLPEAITIDQAFGNLDLPSLDARSADSAQVEDQPMHRVPVLHGRRYEMVAAIPPGSGASAWESNICPECGIIDVHRETATCPNCQGPLLLRPVLRESDGSWRLIKGFRSSSYRRIAPDRPSATITTASGHVGSDRTLHPWENRVLSPAECAHLQTFPPDFEWGMRSTLGGIPPSAK